MGPRNLPQLLERLSRGRCSQLLRSGGGDTVQLCAAVAPDGAVSPAQQGAVLAQCHRLDRPCRPGLLGAALQAAVLPGASLCMLISTAAGMTEHYW